MSHKDQTSSTSINQKRIVSQNRIIYDMALELGTKARSRGTIRFGTTVFVFKHLHVTHKSLHGLPIQLFDSYESQTLSRRPPCLRRGLLSAGAWCSPGPDPSLEDDRGHRTFDLYECLSLKIFSTTARARVGIPTRVFSSHRPDAGSLLYSAGADG